MFFSPVPEKEIPDFIAHGSIIQVFTVVPHCRVSLKPTSNTPARPPGNHLNTSQKYHSIMLDFHQNLHVLQAWDE